MKMAVPITLNNKCITAALLAAGDVPMLDNKAVTHVPIFWPKITGKAMSISINHCMAKA